jgi:hypothetical protein
MQHPIQYLTKEWIDKQFLKYGVKKVDELVYEELRSRIIYLICSFIVSKTMIAFYNPGKDDAFTDSQFIELARIYSMPSEIIDVTHKIIEGFLFHSIQEMVSDMKKSGEKKIQLRHGLTWWNQLKFHEKLAISDELHDEIREYINSHII